MSFTLEAPCEFCKEMQLLLIQWLGEVNCTFCLVVFCLFWFIFPFSFSHAQVCPITLAIFYAYLKWVAFTVFLIIFIIGLGICLCGIQISRKLASKHIKLNSV